MIFKSLLIVHILAGAIALLLGSIVMVIKKGNERHRLLGKWFAICMLLVGVSSLALAFIHPNSFLFSVGIFTIYLTATSWRFLKLKEIPKGQKAKTIDWILQGFMLLASLWFLKLGVTNLIHKQYFGLILLLFGWRGFTFVYQDYQTYKGIIKQKNYWLLLHLQRMIGAYIAALTAFLVVNFDNRLSFVAWLLPTIILVPFIIKWSKKFGSKQSM